MTPRPWLDFLGPQERLVAEGYRSPRRFRPRPALVLIDLYNRAFGPRSLPYAEAITEEPSSCGEVGWKTLPTLERYLATAREHGVPVVYTISNERYAALGEPTLRSVHSNLDDETSLAADDHPRWGNRIVEQLSPVAGEVVIEKTRASAFYGTPLDSMLRSLSVNSLILVGESTSGCVRASAVDAYSAGFDVAVAADGTFDRSPLSHAVSLFDLNLKYATIVDFDAASALMSAKTEQRLTPDGEVVSD